jgi:anti-sigma regulatory factor (Ser/Thr protein kinase)
MEMFLARSLDEIALIVAATDQFFIQHRIDSSLRTAVDLCIEELFVNMVKYNTETQREILLEMEPVGGGIEVSLTDSDVERFDSTIRREINIDAPLAERKPGGLGVYLVLKMVDSIHYEYHDRQSRITFQITGGKTGV